MKLEVLAKSVTGNVLVPGDDGFEEARSTWNVRFDRRPDVIVRCEGAGDVKAAVDFARDRDLLLSVKGGGHAYAANTVGDGGLLIDLSQMNVVHIDPEASIARVGPGATWGEFNENAEAFGLATPGGTVSTVGVAGLTLGGGSGYLSRRFGLTLDNLLSCEVVTADGRLLRASETENPDLFWGLRGGGGNFGIVTLFEFRLHKVGPEVLAGQIVHRFEDAGEVLRLYRDYMAEAPEELQCYAFVLRVPAIDAFPKTFHGELAIDLVVCYSGADGEAVIQPLLDFGDPILTAVGPQPYTVLTQAFDAGLPAGQRYDSRTHYMAGISDEAIETFIGGIGALPGAFSVVYFGWEGGAIGRVDPAATSFFHRDAAYLFHILPGWTDPSQDSEVMEWATRLHEAMAPHANGGAYVNLLGDGEKGRVRAAYGDNYGRLIEVKNRWDPKNLFRMNHNIEPTV